jgi:hypothetical protein
MNLIAWPYRLLALAALGIALFGFGWFKGTNHVQAKWNAATAAQQQSQVQVQIQQAEATVQVVTQYVDRIQVVREKGIPPVIRRGFGWGRMKSGIKVSMGEA